MIAQRPLFATLTTASLLALCGVPAVKRAMSADCNVPGDCSNSQCMEHGAWHIFNVDDDLCWDEETDSATILESATNVYTWVSDGGTLVNHPTMKIRDRSATQCNEPCPGKPWQHSEVVASPFGNWDPWIQGSTCQCSGI